MEDWALIRRLVADGVPQRQVARDLGIARDTVAAAVRSAFSERSPTNAGARSSNASARRRLPATLL